MAVPGAAAAYGRQLKNHQGINDSPSGTQFLMRYFLHHLKH